MSNLFLDLSDEVPRKLFNVYDFGERVGIVIDVLYYIYRGHIKTTTLKE